MSSESRSDDQSVGDRVRRIRACSKFRRLCARTRAACECGSQSDDSDRTQSLDGPAQLRTRLSHYPPRKPKYPPTHHSSPVSRETHVDESAHTLSHLCPSRRSAQLVLCSKFKTNNNIAARARSAPELRSVRLGHHTDVVVALRECHQLTRVRRSRDPCGKIDRPAGRPRRFVDKYCDSCAPVRAPVRGDRVMRCQLANETTVDCNNKRALCWGAVIQ